MSSIQSFWSGVKRSVRRLIGSESSEASSGKDLRDQLNERIEAEKQKARGAEELRQELLEAQGEMKTLSNQFAELRRTSKEGLLNVRGRLEELSSLVRRLGATLAAKEKELERIEAAAENLRARRLVTTISAAVMSSIIAPGFLVASLWTFNGPLPSILTKENRMSPKEIETMEAGQELRRARQNLSRRDSIRLENLIQESR
jgi:hypothetical protein